MTSFTHFARLVSVGEHELVDDDVVRVDATLGQFLDQTLGLVQRQELSDAHTDEGGLFLEGGWQKKKKEETLKKTHSGNVKYVVNENIFYRFVSIVKNIL